MMEVPDWVIKRRSLLILWVSKRPESFVGAERIVVAGNAGGVVATLSLIGTMIGSGGSPSTVVFWVLVVFIGGLGAALLGRWAEAIWEGRRPQPASWPLFSRFGLLGAAMLLLVVGIVFGLIELYTFTR